MRKTKNTFFLLLVAFILNMPVTGCYHKPDARPHAQNDTLTVEQMDSITFALTHHYSHNYNFVVSADSLMLTRQMPEEAVSDLPTDSFAINRDETLAVADIIIMPNDTVDSVGAISTCRRDVWVDT